MKVYGGNFFLPGTIKQVRGIIAGTQRQAAMATGSSLSHIRTYWCQTGNEIELAAAMARPGVLLWCEDRAVKSVEDYKDIQSRTKGPVGRGED